MQKWEYKTMMQYSTDNELYIDGKVVAKGDYSTTSFLQQLGEEGWELAGVVSECCAHGRLIPTWTGIWFYFKRPRP
jgi:hypothetical protein